jgi:hypothetical protein
MSIYPFIFGYAGIKLGFGFILNGFRTWNYNKCKGTSSGLFFDSFKLYLEIFQKILCMKKIFPHEKWLR